MDEEYEKGREENERLDKGREEDVAETGEKRGGEKNRVRRSFSGQ